MIAPPIEHLRHRQNAGPMSDDELACVEDIRAFIEFGMRNGLSFAAILGRLHHDIDGLRRHGFDLDVAKADAFQPQVSGYSSIDEESVGETEEPQYDERKKDQLMNEEIQPDDDDTEITDEFLKELEAKGLLSSQEGADGPVYWITQRGVAELDQFQASVRDDVVAAGGLLGAVSRFFVTIESHVSDEERCGEGFHENLSWKELISRVPEDTLEQLVEDLGQAALVEKNRKELEE